MGRASRKKREARGGAKPRHAEGSRRTGLLPSASPEAQAVDRAAKIARVEDYDSYATIRNNLRSLTHERGDWSGVPLPVGHARLVVEPSYKYAGIADIPAWDVEKEGECASDGYTLRNVFWSWRWNCRIAVWENPDGRCFHQKVIGSRHTLKSVMNTIGCCDVWGIEQESNALELLGTMLRHRNFKQYLLAGGFFETSERSGVTYLFRKLRPTVAMTSRTKDGNMKILCSMCMHPIGYYEGTWAGAMCPTDDVIAHLALMRGDERMFWRRCNQHPPHDPLSGI